MLTLLVGGFFGDEGKGKVASYLALKDEPSISLRTGAVNAGHTVILQGREWKIRAIPSAFVNPKTRIGLGPGALTNLGVLFKELEETGSTSRFFLDPHVGVISDQEVEEERQDDYLMKVVGSTGQGVGYAESKRVLRKLKLASDYPELGRFLTDVPASVVEAVERGEEVLVEGTQGHMLSLYHGHYPYVTSRNTTASGILSEVGVGPKYVREVIVVFKSFVTRVGQGALEGELDQVEAEKLGLVERGTVTGRLRRVAPFNMKLAKQVVKVNGATQVAITKLDWLFKGASGIRRYQDLPVEAKRWIEEIQGELKVPVTIIGTGSDTYDVIDLRREAAEE